MRTLIQDLRFALRQLRRAPGFTLTVVLTVALGIAATTVVFSLVNAVLLRPLPFPEPDRLISLDTLGRAERTTGPSTVRAETSYPNFFDWRSQNKSFSSMSSYTTGGSVLGAEGNSRAQRVAGVQVSGDFFDTLGVAPELGRGFTRAEEQPGTRSVVLSYQTWQTVFGGDRSVLGRTITLSDDRFTVVGVMPKSFYFPIDHPESAFWITMARDAEGKEPSTRNRGWNQLNVIGRLRPGVTVAQAKAEMDMIQQGLAAQYPDDVRNEVAVSVIPELQDIVSEVRTPLRILFGAVFCLLLMVCVNVAGLLLSRTNKRRGEMALRTALGASRAQVLRQLLVESVTLSTAGGALGILLAGAALKAAPKLLPGNLPRVDQIAMSGEVLGFAVVISLLTGLVFGVLPAWRVSKQDPSSALAENSRSATTGKKQYRLQSALVIAQTAIGLVLLVGAGLLIRSFDRILKADPGFSPDHMLTFRLSVPSNDYGGVKRSVLLHDLTAKLRALPGVQMATGAYPLPLTVGDIHITFTIEGRPVKKGDEPGARLSLTGPEFFETLKIPLVRGRYFLPTEQDAKGRPVVIVNEAFAKKYFPGQDAVGQHMTPGVSGEDAEPPLREIVGVVGSVKRESITEAVQPEYYIPFEQAPIAMPAVAMRVTGDPLSYANAVRAQVAAIDPGLPIYRVMSYSDDLQRSSAQQRFQTMLLAGFAGIALLLAAVGLYGMLSYMVSQRTMELGLRMALGAQRGDVLELILLRGLRLAGAGLLVGLGTAAVLSRLIAGVLYRVDPLDLATFAGTTAVLLGVSCAASLVPAYRASRLEPVETLRNG